MTGWNYSWNPVDFSVVGETMNAGSPVLFMAAAVAGESYAETTAFSGLALNLKGRSVLVCRVLHDCEPQSRTARLGPAFGASIIAPGKL